MKVPMTTVEFLDRAVDVYGDFVGVVADDGTEFTYKEFNERVNRLSNVFLKWGLEYGDRVAILSFNTHWLLETFYATNQLGIVHVPLNYRLKADEFLYILNDCTPEVLIVDYELTPQIEKIRDKLTSVKHFVAYDADKAEGDWDDYDTLLEGSDPATPARPEFSEDDIATINYTSGTTGEPKGVMRTFRTEHWHALMLSNHQEVKDNDVYLWTLPMFHVNGWGHIYFMTGMGAKHICLKKVDAGEVFRRIREYDVTYLCAAPTVLNMLISYQKENPDIPTAGENPVRIATAGSPPPQATIEKIENEFGWNLSHIYGATEVGPIVTTSHSYKMLEEYDKFDLKKKQGAEVLGCQVKVVDENGEDVPWDDEHIGEIVVRGNQVMEGYWNKPEDTEEAFNAKRPGWFHLGDLATIDKNGFCEIKDREKDIIISGGENISSVEVENVLYKHPKVAQCAVIGVPHEKWGETPKAVIVLNDDSEPPSEDQLKKFCKEKIANYKTPTMFEFVDSLPTTATGKVQKFELRAKEK